MTPDEFDRFDAIIQGFADCFDQPLTAQGSIMRFKAMERAALSFITGRKYSSMPTMADFLEYLGGGSAEEKAEPEPRYKTLGMLTLAARENIRAFLQVAEHMK